MQCQKLQITLRSCSRNAARLNKQQHERVVAAATTAAATAATEAAVAAAETEATTARQLLKATAGVCEY